MPRLPFPDPPLFFAENVWLPEYDKCRVNFLQLILQDEKKVLRNDEVQHLNFPMATYEYAVQNVWDHVKDHAGFCEYMPTEEIEGSARSAASSS